MKCPTWLLSENFIQTRGITEDTPFEIVEIEPEKLVCPERLDLMAKLPYIAAKENNADMSFVRELYSKHIEAFSEGTFEEPGDKNKRSLDDYYRQFDRLIENIKTNGFDDSVSMIPADQNNVILDGGHRAACALYFKKSVKIIKFNVPSVCFDANYFAGRQLSDELIKYMVNQYCRYTEKKMYCCCIWPVADLNKRDAALTLIKRNKIVFHDRITISYNGLRNFMLQIYYGQNWIGNSETEYSGILGKVDECYAPSEQMDVIFFEGGELNEVLQLKEEIRSIFGLDKHSVHISDSNEETVLMSELLLNNNSVYALNYGTPYKSARFVEGCVNKKTGNGSDTLSYYGIASDKLLQGNCGVDPYNPRAYFAFMNNKLPVIDNVKKELRSMQGNNATAVLTELNKYPDHDENAKKRNAQYRKVSRKWKMQKAVLRTKQIMAACAERLGLYSVLHKLHNAIRERN